MDNEKEDLQTKGYLLSIDSWITVLGSEINWNRERFYHERNTSLVLGTLFVAFVAGFFTILTTDIISAYSTILLAIFVAIYVVHSIREVLRTQKRINTLERIRDDTIFRRSDLKEICKRWEEYRKALRTKKKAKRI